MIVVIVPGTIGLLLFSLTDIMADTAGGQPIDEVTVGRAILDTQNRYFMEYLDIDVAIVGAGPAGLTAAYYIGEAGFKVAVFDRKLGVGGGMLGGGMLYPRYM